MAQIGTIRLQTQNNGTVDVPVFDTGDSGSSVYEFVRVQTAGGTGFIPVVDPADANFPYLRVQSQNQGVVAVHNEATLSAAISALGGFNYYGAQSQDKIVKYEDAGSVQWTFTTSEFVECSVAYDNGVVYSADGNGNAYALDADTGNQVWQSANTYQRAEDAVLVNEDIVYWTGESGIVALNVSDGTEAWTNNLGGTKNNFRGSPSYGNGNIYAAEGGTIYSFDPSTGNTNWTNSYNSNFDSTETVPAAYNNNVYVGGTGGIESYTSGGSFNWDSLTSSTIIGAPAIYNGTLYVMDKSNNNLTAIDESTGNVDWSVTVTIGGDGGGSPVVADGKVYFTDAQDGSDNSYCVDISSQTVDWTFSHSDNIYSPGALNVQYYIVAEATSGIVAIDKDTGNEAWRVNESGSNDTYSTVVIGHGDGWSFGGMPGRLNQNTSPIQR